MTGLGGVVHGAGWPEASLFGGEDRGGVVGSAACRDCHRDFHERWEQSRHGASVRGVTVEWAEGVFGELPVRLESEEGGHMLEGMGAEVWMRVGGGEKLRVLSALGGRDVWYLLTEWGDPVRLQVLPMAYDLRRREWFSPGAEAGGMHGGGVGVEWTAASFTFSGGCYACHVSGGGSGRLESGAWWEEPGIRCESCHGPGGEHVRECRAVGEGEIPADLKIIAAGSFTSGQMEGLCGSCHGRVGVIGAGFRPGDLFADHFDLALWEDANFGPGGREEGETYTMTSWQANRCAREGGLTCLDCHTSSGRDRFPGVEANRACMPCHEERVEAVEEHSHHVAGGPGGRCVDCHMPVSEFGRMRRHDHSFRAPAPVVSLEFGGRSACGICHEDRGEAWAVEKVREWHGEHSGEGELRRTGLLEAARAGDWSRLDEMLGSLGSEQRHPVYMASMARLLAGCEDGRVVGALVGLLGAESLWVRASAADAMVGRLVPSAVPGLVKLAGDPVRLVRFRAASALAALPEGVLEEEDRVVVERAWGELEVSLLGRSEQVGVMEALGHFYLDRGRAEEAGVWLVRALGEQPENLGLLVSAGTALYRAGDLEGAREWLQGAVRLHPASGLAWANWVKYWGDLGKEEEEAKARREAEVRLEGGQLEEYRDRVRR